MRARNLKAEFFKNPDLAALGTRAMILFAGLWCFADREGRFLWDPRRIRAEIFPFESDKKCNVMSLLVKLWNHNFIVKYSANGNDYGWIPTFVEHQKPHPHEKKSKIPAPSEDVIKCRDMSLHDIKCKPDIRKEDIRKPTKDLFNEFVRLTKDEHQKLINDYGVELTDEMIDELNNYIGSKGRHYDSHYHTIKAWIRKREKERPKSEGELGKQRRAW